MTGIAHTADGSWELFPHGSDIGVRGVGSTREQAFEQAALALTAVITDVRRVAQRREVGIRCQAPDDELLLYEWLNALVARMALESLLFSRYRVHLHNGSLEAQAWGEAVDVRRHRPAVEVKGATVTELCVSRQANGTWVAQAVVDV